MVAETSSDALDRVRTLRAMADDELANRWREPADANSSTSAVVAATEEAWWRVHRTELSEEQLRAGVAVCSGSIVTGVLDPTPPVLMAACQCVLEGRSLHVMTVDEAGAERLVEELSAPLALLGAEIRALPVGRPSESTWADVCERKCAAYAADVTVGVHSEFGVDYLRDNLSDSRDDVVGSSRDTVLLLEADHLLVDFDVERLRITGEVAGEHQTLARISYGAYVRGYSRIWGETPVASLSPIEVQELQEAYGLDVISATGTAEDDRPRAEFGDFSSHESRLDVLVERAHKRAASGHVVLVGVERRDVDRVTAGLRRVGIEPALVAGGLDQGRAPSPHAEAGEVTVVVGSASRSSVVSSADLSGSAVTVLVVGRTLANRHDERLVALSRQGVEGECYFYLAPGDEVLAPLASRISRFVDRVRARSRRQRRGTRMWRRVVDMIDDVQQLYEQRDAGVRRLRREIAAVETEQRNEVYAARARVVDDQAELADAEQVIARVAGRRSVDGREPIAQWRARVDRLGASRMAEVARIVRQLVLDRCWREHLVELDRISRSQQHLRTGRIERHKAAAAEAFDAMMLTAEERIADFLLTVEIDVS